MVLDVSFNTPLRYPGGKARLGPWLGEVLQFNSINESCYIEPYAGGAGAAIHLLLNKKVKKVILNDLDPSIFYFWKSILEHNDDFIKKIINTNVDMENWFIQKEIHENQSLYNEFEIGFSTFFLNRTNRSGIISAGVIGGKKQQGNYKLDARFNKKNLIDRIKVVGEIASSIDLHNLDCVDFLKSDYICDIENSFFYLDPPYYNKGSTLYENSYNHSEHEQVSKYVKNMNRPWIVTYDCCDAIKGFYHDVNSLEFSFHYSTGLMRPIASEILFYNNIVMPSSPYMTRKK